MESKTANTNKTKLQFSYYDSTLPDRIAEDVRRSSFTTRPKYLNALVERVLSLPKRTASSSHIDEFFAWMDLFETLPTERIRQLAPIQNRNFDQMFKHLLEIALSYYPEDLQSLSAPREETSHGAEIYRPKQANYGSKPDAVHQPTTSRKLLS